MSACVCVAMGVYNTCDVTMEEISRLMVGRDVVLNVQKDKAVPTDTVLRVRGLEYVNEWNKKMLDRVSFDVRKGEILGVAGVEGNGQKELVDALFHFNTPSAGTAAVNGVSILGLSQQRIRELGVSLVPEDRMLFGIAGAASIEENVLSDRSADKRFNRGPLFNMALLHPELFKTRALYVQIETEGEYCRGATVGDFYGVTGKAPNAECLLDVDRAAFADRLVEAMKFYGEGAK